MRSNRNPEVSSARPKPVEGKRKTGLRPADLWDTRGNFATGDELQEHHGEWHLAPEGLGRGAAK